MAMTGHNGSVLLHCTRDAERSSTPFRHRTYAENTERERRTRTAAGQLVDSVPSQNARSERGTRAHRATAGRPAVSAVPTTCAVCTQRAIKCVTCQDATRTRHS